MPDYRILPNPPIGADQGVKLAEIYQSLTAGRPLTPFAGIVEGLSQGLITGANVQSKYLETQRLNDPERLAEEQRRRQVDNETLEQALQKAKFDYEIDQKIGTETLDSQNDLRRAQIEKYGVETALAPELAYADIYSKIAGTGRSSAASELNATRKLESQIRSLQMLENANKARPAETEFVLNKDTGRYEQSLLPQPPEDITITRQREAIVKQMYADEQQAQAQERAEAATQIDRAEAATKAVERARKAVEGGRQARVNIESALEDAPRFDNPNIPGVLGELAIANTYYKDFENDKLKAQHAANMGEIVQKFGPQIDEYIEKLPEGEEKTAAKEVLDDTRARIGDPRLLSDPQRSIYNAGGTREHISKPDKTQADVTKLITEGQLAVDDPNLHTIIGSSDYLIAARNASKKGQQKVQISANTVQTDPNAGPDSLGEVRSSQKVEEFEGEDGTLARAPVPEETPDPKKAAAELDIVRRSVKQMNQQVDSRKQIADAQSNIQPSVAETEPQAPVGRPGAPEVQPSPLPDPYGAPGAQPTPLPRSQRAAPVEPNPGEPRRTPVTIPELSNEVLEVREDPYTKRRTYFNKEFAVDINDPENPVQPEERKDRWKQEYIEKNGLGASRDRTGQRNFNADADREVARLEKARDERYAPLRKEVLRTNAELKTGIAGANRVQSLLERIERVGGREAIGSKGAYDQAKTKLLQVTKLFSTEESQATADTISNIEQQAEEFVADQLKSGVTGKIVDSIPEREALKRRTLSIKSEPATLRLFVVLENARIKKQQEANKLTDILIEGDNDPNRISSVVVDYFASPNSAPVVLNKDKYYEVERGVWDVRPGMENEDDMMLNPDWQSAERFLNMPERRFYADQGGPSGPAPTETPGIPFGPEPDPTDTPTVEAPPAETPTPPPTAAPAPSPTPPPTVQPTPPPTALPTAAPTPGPTPSGVPSPTARPVSLPDMWDSWLVSTVEAQEPEVDLVQNGPGSEGAPPLGSGSLGNGPPWSQEEKAFPETVSVDPVALDRRLESMGAPKPQPWAEPTYTPNDPRTPEQQIEEYRKQIGLEFDSPEQKAAYERGVQHYLNRFPDAGISGEVASHLAKVVDYAANAYLMNRGEDIGIAFRKSIRAAQRAGGSHPLAILGNKAGMDPNITDEEIATEEAMRQEARFRLRKGITGNDAIGSKAEYFGTFLIDMLANLGAANALPKLIGRTALGGGRLVARVPGVQQAIVNPARAIAQNPVIQGAANRVMGTAIVGSGIKAIPTATIDALHAVLSAQREDRGKNIETALGAFGISEIMQVFGGPVFKVAGPRMAAFKEWVSNRKDPEQAEKAFAVVLARDKVLQEEMFQSLDYAKNLSGDGIEYTALAAPNSSVAKTVEELSKYDAVPTVKVTDPARQATREKISTLAQDAAGMGKANDVYNLGSDYKKLVDDEIGDYTKIAQSRAEAEALDQGEKLALAEQNQELAGYQNQLTMEKNTLELQTRAAAQYEATIRQTVLDTLGPAITNTTKTIQSLSNGMANLFKKPPKLLSDIKLAVDENAVTRPPYRGLSQTPPTPQYLEPSLVAGRQAQQLIEDFTNPLYRELDKEVISSDLSDELYQKLLGTKLQERGNFPVVTDTVVSQTLIDRVAVRTSRRRQLRDTGVVRDGGLPEIRTDGELDNIGFTKSNETIEPENSFKFWDEFAREAQQMFKEENGISREQTEKIVSSVTEMLDEALEPKYGAGFYSRFKDQYGGLQQASEALNGQMTVYEGLQNAILNSDTPELTKVAFGNPATAATTKAAFGAENAEKLRSGLQAADRVSAALTDTQKAIQQTGETIDTVSGKLAETAAKIPEPKKVDPVVADLTEDLLLAQSTVGVGINDFFADKLIKAGPGVAAQVAATLKGNSKDLIERGTVNSIKRRFADNAAKIAETRLEKRVGEVPSILELTGMQPQEWSNALDLLSPGRRELVEKAVERQQAAYRQAFAFDTQPTSGGVLSYFKESDARRVFWYNRWLAATDITLSNVFNNINVKTQKQIIAKLTNDDPTAVNDFYRATADYLGTVSKGEYGFETVYLTKQIDLDHAKHLMRTWARTIENVRELSDEREYSGDAINFRERNDSMNELVGGVQNLGRPPARRRPTPTPTPTIMPTPPGASRGSGSSSKSVRSLIDQIRNRR